MWARVDNRYISCRITGNRYNITHGKTKESPVPDHFNGEGHTLADVTILAIDKIHSHNSCLGKIRESRWIWTLRTSYSSGMNFRMDSLWNLHDVHQFLPCGSAVPLFDKAWRYNQKTIPWMNNVQVHYKYNVLSITIVWAHTPLQKKAQRGRNVYTRTCAFAHLNCNNRST